MISEKGFTGQHMQNIFNNAYQTEINKDGLLLWLLLQLLLFFLFSHLLIKPQG